jgi:adenylyltransferase/sulfurtransferase
VDRYIRHNVLSWFGPDGQRKLAGSLVVAVGCGGVGCTCSSFLARAGVGRLRIIDRDVVGITDLHRQILFDETDVAEVRLKTQVAAERLGEANSSVEVEPVFAELSPANAESLTGDADLVVDCTDNFETRMLLNDVCTRNSRPWIHAACMGTAGIVIPFPPAAAACYRCIVDHIPGAGPGQATSNPAILGPVAGAVGAIEAIEAIKMIVSPMHVCQKVIYFDSMSCTWETIEVKPKADCPVCGKGLYSYLDGSEVWSDSRVGGDDTVHLNVGVPIDLDAIRARPPEHTDVVDIGGPLRMKVEGKTVILFADGGAVIKGVTNAADARRLVEYLLQGI